MLKFKQVYLCMAALLIAATVQGEDRKPWALRDHYTFSSDNAKFLFDVQTAEWMVEVTGVGELVRRATAEVELADGTVIRLSERTAFSDDREDFEGALGRGTRFRSVFKIENGLMIDYSIARFKDRPFMMIQVNMVNTSSKPITVREVRPAVFEPGDLAEIGSSVEVKNVHTRRRGNFATLHDGVLSGLLLLEFDDPPMTFGVGVLRSGLMETHVDLQPAGKSYTGRIRSTYHPPLSIAPGSRVGSDSVWMSLFVPDAEDVRSHHAWAEVTGMPPVHVGSIPNGWVTVAPGASAKDLYDVAKAWEGDYVRYALVPAGWEEAPGSTHGRKPDYPRDMAKVAAEIRDIGMIPGITLDPLTADGGDPKWVVTGADGSRWLDLGHPDARAFAMARVQDLIRAGFEFFVVDRSRIPDDILTGFNTTRAQSDLFALEVVTVAAEGRAVLPSASMSLDGDIQRWEEAAWLTGHMRKYGVVAGPIRIDAGALGGVSRALEQAIKGFHGPVEIIGTPKRNVRSAVGEACCSEPFAPPRAAKR